MKTWILITVFVSMLLGMLVSYAFAGCTVIMLPDGRMVSMCCSPDGRLCQIM